MTVSRRTAVKKASVDSGERDQVSEPGIKVHCDACGNDITGTVRIRCAQEDVCHQFDLCGSCFLKGEEPPPPCRHKAWHDYRVVEQHAYPIFDQDWGADEELLMIEGCELYGIGNWADIATYIGSRNKQDVEEHYIRSYIDVDSYPEPDTSQTFDVSKEEFSQKRLQRVTAFRTQIPPLPVNSANRKPLVSAPTNHEIQGYMPGRLDFETEAENEAEVGVKDMEFGAIGSDEAREVGIDPTLATQPEALDSPVKPESAADEDQKPSVVAPVTIPESASSLRLKLTILEIYNSRLDRRAHHKRFIFDRGLLEYRKNQIAERKRLGAGGGILTREERDLMNRCKVYARLQTTSDYEAFVSGLMNEISLRRRIADLQEYRSQGLLNMIQVEPYERAKANRLSHRALPLRESVSSSSFDRLGLGGGLSNGHLLAPSNQRNRNGKSDESRKSREGTPKRSMTQTSLSLSTAQSLQLLLPAEQLLCSTLHILPHPYLQIKEILLRAKTTQQETMNANKPSKRPKLAPPASTTGMSSAASGKPFSKAMAREILGNIDGTKVDRIWDFFVTVGWIEEGIKVDET